MSGAVCQNCGHGSWWHNYGAYKGPACLVSIGCDCAGYVASISGKKITNLKGVSTNEEVITVDVVNHPSHYKFDNGVEVIDLTEQLNFNCGNVVKYTARAGRKDKAKTLEDLRKAEFYIKREIARVERDETL